VEKLMARPLDTLKFYLGRLGRVVPHGLAGIPHQGHAVLAARGQHGAEAVCRDQRARSSAMMVSSAAGSSPVMCSAAGHCALVRL
jgi:hypothetical protein